MKKRQGDPWVSPPVYGRSLRGLGINLLVRDLSRGREPWCMLTADFLLVGDISRPDLAQDGRDGAVQLFREALPKLRELPDFVEVYPGHVAGST